MIFLHCEKAQFQAHLALGGLKRCGGVFKSKGYKNLQAGK
jgi:hypothetical protein